ncbi:MAG: caspase family protein, partial [Simkaniaceae bacterium]|nr:caspase family protein [Simkaniaceae bacterium]
NIERKLATFYRKANEAKEGYFHYSGLGDDGNIEPTDHLDSGSLPGKKLIDDMREHIKKGVQVTLTLDMPTQPLLPNVWNASGEYIQRAAPGKEKGPRIIALSLSEDSEKGRGGLTKALLSTMKDYGYSITYRQLLAGMKSYMEKYGIKQSPQLASSTPLDLDDYFIYNHVRLRPSKAPEPILERKVNKVDGVMTTPPPAKETNKPKLRNNKKNAPTKTKPTPKVVNKSAKIVKPSVTKKSPPKKSPPKKVAVKKKPATTPKKKASPPKKIVKKTPSKSKSRKK